MCWSPAMCWSPVFPCALGSFLTRLLLAGSFSAALSRIQACGAWG